ncbi:cold shock domain-containing protein [Sphingobacterium sp.]|uniref:cold-shock protein n=1 Tax=Sphingobacterium sp. TaxID=341027 RepID=UPI002897B581|nr:cold shock domain-containing protein [Sphingobacterium sp.]
MHLLLIFMLLKQNSTPAMFIGAVKWFDNNKGFGTIALPAGEELFVHIRRFKIPPEHIIQPGEVIVGDKKADPKRSGYLAHNCRILKRPEDWKFVISLLDKEHTVHLPDSHGREQKHNLTSLTARQLLRIQPKDLIPKMLTANFDVNFDSSIFIPYAEIIDKSITGIFEREIAGDILSKVFEYFGRHVSHQILFRVWKEGRFKYIGYPSEGDYEIPELVFNLNATEINYEDLTRISTYSFGKSFCTDFVNALFDDVETMDKSDLEPLLPYIEFLENETSIEKIHTLLQE